MNCNARFAVAAMAVALSVKSIAAVDFVALDDDQVRRLEDAVPVYSSEEFVTDSNVLGFATGYSCRRDFSDQDVSREQGLAQLRLQATKKSGNAIAGAECSAPTYGDASIGCIRFIKCTGKIIKAAGQPAAAPSQGSALANETARQQDPRDQQQPQTSSAEVSTRAEAWANYFNETVTKARSGKVKPLARLAASLSGRFYELFPEEKNNPYLREYFAYLAVLAERVDAKKITFAEAEYALAQKQREWAEANAATAERIEAQRAEAQRIAAREAATQRAEQERYRREAEIAAMQTESASRQAAASAMLNAGMGILQMNQNRAMMNYLNRPTVCNWMWNGRGYTQICQ